MNLDDVTDPAHRGDDCRIPLADEAATAALGARLAPLLTPGSVVFLSGDLGAGKTVLSRALIRSLGYNGRVKSPTFSLVEPYNLSRYTLYHFDFYRFSSEDELREAGFEEQLDSAAVALVEWPEKLRPALPRPTSGSGSSLAARPMPGWRACVAFPTGAAHG
ncbi:MAG: tRNA (adenosine(37)-N6)-threonylcarbamoyltransferase complex ATPase subunit type 1 TsaE [Burkholderiaceae bacterium]